MTRKALGGVLALLGIATVVAFFLPFFDIGHGISASGWDMLWNGRGLAWTWRLAMLGVPIGGLAMIGAGASGHKSARWIGAGFGVGVFGYMTVQLVRLFFATTGWGMWITLVVAAAAIGLAFFAKKNER
jgi:hypothetical protein